MGEKKKSEGWGGEKGGKLKIGGKVKGRGGREREAGKKLEATWGRTRENSMGQGI